MKKPEKILLLKLSIAALLFTITVIPTATAEERAYGPEGFFANLSELCGNSYNGDIVYPSSPPDGFEGQLVAHFSNCGDDYINIPFHVGENESRTWILSLTDAGLLFKHDHRHPDGTPEELTNYGGWAEGGPSSMVQRFPADDETIAMRDNLRSHIWVFEISDDFSRLSYSLYLYENLYFRADFDLNNPL